MHMAAPSPLKKERVKQGTTLPGQFFVLPVFTISDPWQPPTLIDFEEASETVGDFILNAAQVRVQTPDGAGNTVGAFVVIVDTDQASDGGCTWQAGNSYRDGNNQCSYPVVQVRARAEISAVVFRIDFDGYDADGSVGLIDLDGPWDFQNGDRPTLHRASVECCARKVISPLASQTVRGDDLPL
jgi:hypothetical protein